MAEKFNEHIGLVDFCTETGENIEKQASMHKFKAGDAIEVIQSLSIQNVDCAMIILDPPYGVLDLMDARCPVTLLVSSWVQGVFSILHSF